MNAASAPWTGCSRRWDLRRNCSLTPRQTGHWYLVTLGVAVVLALAALWFGAYVISLFFLVEMLVLTGALRFYARHAVDRDVVELEGCGLTVSRIAGGRVRQLRLNLGLTPVRVIEAAGGIELRNGNRVLAVVGSQVGPQVRQRAAHELASAIAAAARAAP